MKQRLVWFTQLSMALAIAASVNISSVAAATPSSSLKALPERINTRSVTLSYVTSGDGGEISKVELYSKKGDSPFVRVATVTTPNDAFVIDFMTSGDGRYAFHTVAYLKNATETTDDDVAETGKSTLEETATVVDTVNPPAPDSSHIYVNQAASLQVNEISGYGKGVEGSALVKVYADSGLNRLVAATYANPDGSFGPVEVGTSAERPNLWVVAIDANGNQSVATLIENKLSYSAAVTNLVVTASSETQLNVIYTAPTDAAEYIVYYRHAGGAVWSAMVRTKDTAITLTGLEAGRAYDVRVAPVNSSASVGTYAFAAQRTSGTPLGDVVLASEAPKSAAVNTANTVTTTSTAAAVDTTTDQTTASAATTKPADVPATDTADKAAPADSAAADTAATDQAATDTADQAAIDAAATDQAAADNQPSSATPWVILAILIILAGIATGGYFYWFSGPEEVTTTVSDAPSTEKPKEEAKKEEDVDKRW